MSNFLEYSNKNQINIVPQDEFENLTQMVFNVIAENIGRSLGPLGSSAMILDGMCREATKDGYTIMKNYCFRNKYKKMIHELIKAPCTKLNNTVGDGTTTAIVLARYLFNEYQQNKNDIKYLYRMPRTFIQLWDEVIENLSNKIKSYSVELKADDYDKIYNLAYVASNGNKEISDNLVNAYKAINFPNIIQKDSPTNKSYIKEISGYEFPSHLIDEGYVRNEDLSVKENNMKVMIFDHKIDHELFANIIHPINSVLRAKGIKLLVAAPFYDVLLCNTVLRTEMNKEYQKFGKLNLILTQYNMSQIKKNQLIDLSSVVDGIIINQELAPSIAETIKQMGEDSFCDKLDNQEFEYYHLLGEIEKASLSCVDNSILKVNVENNKRYNETLRSAIAERDEILRTISNESQTYSEKVYDANYRISQLEMKNFIYYIGADSALQKKITWDSVEDVIKCLRSAVKHGTIPGCQISIMRACAEYIAEVQTPYAAEENKEMTNLDMLRTLIAIMIARSCQSTYFQIINGPSKRGILMLSHDWYKSGLSEDKDKRKEELEEKVNKVLSLIKESVILNKVFDLETLEFNENIITSTETDINILIAASELIKILISGNQCIYVDVELNSVTNDIDFPI